jgi:hypothetical protein
MGKNEPSYDLGLQMAKQQPTRCSKEEIKRILRESIDQWYEFPTLICNVTLGKLGKIVFCKDSIWLFFFIFKTNFLPKYSIYYL